MQRLYHFRKFFTTNAFCCKGKSQGSGKGAACAERCQVPCIFRKYPFLKTIFLKLIPPNVIPPYLPTFDGHA